MDEAFDFTGKLAEKDNGEEGWGPKYDMLLLHLAFFFQIITLWCSCERLTLVSLLLRYEDFIGNGKKKKSKPSKRQESDDEDDFGGDNDDDDDDDEAGAMDIDQQIEPVEVLILSY